MGWSTGISLYCVVCKECVILHNPQIHTEHCKLIIPKKFQELSKLIVIYHSDGVLSSFILPCSKASPLEHNYCMTFELHCVQGGTRWEPEK